MFKRRLFKRTLPVILSAAMMFQSLPMTAMAAEYQEPKAVVESAENAKTANAEAMNAEDANAEAADANAANAENTDADAANAETAQEETANAETAFVSDAQGDADTDSSQGNDNAVSETEAKSESDGTQPEAGAPENESKQDGTSPAVSDLNEGEEGAKNVIIKVDDGIGINNEIANFTRVIGKEELTFATKYNEKSRCAGFVNALKNYIYISVDNKKDDYLSDNLSNNLKESLTYTWEGKSGEAYASLTSGLPTNAGEYRLKISLNAEGIGSAETYIYVVIEKAELTLNIPADALTIKPGQSVQDLKSQLAKDYTLKNATGDIIDDAKAIVAENGFASQIYEVKNGARTELTDSAAVFSSKGDYIAVVTVTLDSAIADNYTVDVEELYKITVGDLQKTKVVYTLADAGKEISKPYEKGKKADLAWIAFLDDASKPHVVYTDKEGNDVQVSGTTADTVKAEWYMREQSLTSEDSDEVIDGSELTVSDNYQYRRLDGAPEDAGEYFVIYGYAGEEGKYEKSYSAPISVVITPRQAVIAIDEGVSKLFAEGMKNADITKQLSKLTYKVLPVNEDGTFGQDVNGNAFFGVSYEGDDKQNKEQYYVPVFGLQRRIISVKGEDGTYVPVTEEQKKENEGAYNWKSLDDKGLQSKDGAYGYEYRVRFTGDKAVYNANGNVFGKTVSVTDTSTNSADKNHLVDVSEKTLDDNAVVLELANAAETKINAEPIVTAFHNATKDNNDYADGDGTLENPAVKIYDGATLFKDRKAYKVAEAVTSDNAKVNGATLDDFTYKWSYVDLDTYQNRVEAYGKLTDEEKKEEDFDNFTWYPFGEEIYGSTNPDDGSFAYTSNANVYKLHIHYNGSTNPASAYLPADKDVYFKVERQQVIVELDENQFARAGQGIDDWKYPSTYEYNDDPSRLNKNNIGVYKIPKNNRANYDGSKKESINNSYSGNSDVFTYSVVRREKSGAQDTDKWIALDSSEGEFVKDYKYGVYAEYNTNNYTTTDNAAADEESKVHKSITEINWLGEQQLYIDVDWDKVKALSRDYTGEALTLPNGYDFIKIYGNKEKTEDITDAYLNTTDAYDAAKVNVYWNKIDDGESYEMYRTGGVIYGGYYGLVLRFQGDTQYIFMDDGYYSQWRYYSWEREDCGFEIRKIPLMITPKLKSASSLKAGDTADTLVTNELTVVGAVKKDEAYFKYAEKVEGDFNSYEYSYDGGNLIIGSHGYDIDKNGGYPAFNGGLDYKIQIDDEEIKAPWNTYLRSGRKYTVKLLNGLANPLSDSYDVTFKPAEATVTNRGEGRVEGENIDVTYAYENHTYSVMPRDAVKFYYSDQNESVTVTVDGKTKKLTDCNLIAYKIYAPKEFEGTTSGTDFAANSRNFIFEKSVKEAGGYILSGTKNNVWVGSGGSHYVTVLFPVTETDKEKAFTITWEEGYTDTFKLANVVLEADLSNAVAPKSLAFNGVQAKMAVGERQALDVKITKAQLGDIINIRYRIKDDAKSEYISIDPETGVVTALKAGKQATTVEAYPVYRDENGELKQIEGTKAASAKITVNAVTAPAIKGITKISDVSAIVSFASVDNGYRREIYLIDVTANADAKKWKPDAVEEKVKAIKNGQWSDTFAVKPVFAYGNAALGEKAKLVEQQLSGLKPNTTYLVYVRNVSAARTLDDGSVVELSAAGTVKTFTTTKSQVRRLEPKFDAAESAEAVDKAHPVYLKKGEYTIALSSKSAQLNVDGLFIEREDGNMAAEQNSSQTDMRRYRLAPKGALPKEYQAPKLVYGIFDSMVLYDEAGNYCADPWKAGLKPSKYAAISNSGKITVKGVDLDGEKTVYIWVKTDNYDSDNYDYCEPARIPLTIVANADTVTGKKAKLKVGDTVSLSDYLEYKGEKKKIPEYRSSYLMISDEMIQAAQAAGYKVWDAYRDSYYYNYHNWKITAVSPNKTAFSLEVTDRLNGSEVKTAVTLTSAALDPVKGLKAVYVDDKNITLNFTHAGNPDAFTIEVKDARGKIVESRIAYKNDCVVDYSKKELAQKKQQWILSKQFLGSSGTDNIFAYFKNTGTYAYTFTSSRLVRLSSYTVTVTPVYGNQTAKPASVKANTTNIPADRNADWGLKIDGDSYIQVTTGYANQYSRGYFTSGNTYTLSLEGTTDGAKDRVTDTLTWKSSDTKVASIKANAGTYTAALKAVKPGKTTISVTSKITKREIERYTVFVKSVGNGDSFGGDYEKTWDEEFYKDILAKWDPYYEGRLEVLTLSNKVVVDNKVVIDNKIVNDYNTLPSGYVTWVSFTAPNFGQYKFSYNNAAYTSAVYDGRTGNRKNIDPDGLLLEAGQKIYFRLVGDFTLSVSSNTEFAKLTADNNSEETALVVKDKEWVSFTAPEDSKYTFKGAQIISVRRNNEEKSTSGSYTLNAGETLFLCVNAGSLYVEYTKTADMKAIDTEGNTTAEATLTKTDAVQYVKFTAPITARYGFTAKMPQGVKVEYFNVFGDEKQNGERVDDIKTLNALDDGNGEGGVSDGTITDTTTLTVVKGQTVVIKFTAPDSLFEASGSADGSENNSEAGENAGNTQAAKEFKVSVTVSAPKLDKEVSADKTETVEKGTAAMVSFAIPKENGKYQFTAEHGTIDSLYDSEFKKVNGFGGSLIVEDGVVRIKGVAQDVKPEDTVYLEVAAENAEQDATVKVTKITAAELSTDADSVLTVVNGGEYWYTFTAKTAGEYFFDAVVTPNGEGKETHEVTLNEYSKLFDGSKLKVLSAEKAEKLELGEKVIFKADIAKESADSTQVTVSVKNAAADAKAFTTVNPADVNLAKKGNEAYYVFTATSDDTYTFTWKPAENSGEAVVTYGANLTSVKTELTAPYAKKMNTGEVLYFKVKASADNAQGTLSVTADKDGVETIVVNQAAEYDLKENNRSKKFRFIVPEDSDLGYAVVTTFNADESGQKPVIKVTGLWSWSSTLDVPYGTFNTGKGKAITLTISAAEKDFKGTITIMPISAETITADKEGVAVTNTAPKYYQYVIPAYGRYQFTYQTQNVTFEYDSENAYDGIFNGVRLGKGDIVTIRAYTDQTEAQTVTVKIPELITPETLEVKANEITLGANAPKYYAFTADSHAEYKFDQGEADVSIEIFKGDDNWSELYGNGTLKLQKDDTLFIKMLNNTDQEVKFNYTIASNAITELTVGVGSDEKALKSGAEAKFEVRIYEKGIYVFQTQAVSEGAALEAELYNEDGVGRTLYTASSEHYNGFYAIKEFDRPNVLENITVFNTSADEANEAKFQVLVSKVEPTVLTVGKNAGIEINKGEAKIVTFKAPADGRYQFASGNEKVALRYKTGSADASGERVLMKDTEVTYKLVNLDDQEAAQTAEPVITEVSPAPMSGEKIEDKIGKGASKWYAYTAGENGKYSFAFDPEAEGLSFALYEKLTDTSPMAGATVQLQKDETVYVKLTSETDQFNETAFVLKVTWEKVNALDESVKIEKGKTASFALNIDKAGVYTIKAKEPVKNADLTVTFDSDSSTVLYENDKDGFVIVNAYSSRVKDIINVTNNGEEDIELAVTVESVKATELSVENSPQTFTIAERAPQLVTVKYSGVRHYIVDSGNRNVLYCENAGVKPFPYTIKSESTSTGSKSLLLVNESGKAQTTQLTLTQETPEELYEGIAYTIGARDFKWFSYTAEEAGTYSFSCRGVEGEALITELYSSIDSYSQLESSVALEAGGTVYVKVKNTYSNDVTATFRITQIKTYTITPDSEAQSITLGAGEAAEITAKISATGYYAFRFKNGGALNVSSNNGYKYQFDMNGSYVYVEYCYYYKTTKYTVTNSGNYKVTFEASAESIKENSFTVGDTQTIDMEAGTVQIMKWSVSESGIYSVSSDSQSVEYIDGSYGGSYGRAFPCYVNVTSSYMLFLLNNTESRQSAALTLEKEEPLEITGAGEYPFTVKANGGQKYIEFTADKNATYSFKVEGTVQFTDVNSSSSTVSDRWMDSDEKRTFKAVNNGSTDVTCTLTVTAKEPAKYDKLQFNSADQTETVSFTADKSGLYDIYGYTMDISRFKAEYSINGGEARTGNIYSYSGSSSKVWSGVYLSKDDTITIRVTPNVSGSSTQEYNHSAAIRIEFVKEIQTVTGTGALTLTDSSSDSSYAWFIFTADQTAMYTFELTEGDSKKSFYVYKNYDSGSSDYSSGSMSKWMDEGSRIFLRVYKSNKTDVEYTLTVTAKEPLWYETLQFERTDETKVTSTYTVTENGFYSAKGTALDGSFRAESSINGEVNNNTTIYSSSDNGLFTNRYLQKGDQVSFTVYPNGTYDEPQEYNHSAVIRIEKGWELTPITGAGSHEVTVPAKGETWVEFTAGEEDAAYNFTWSEQSNVSVNYYKAVVDYYTITVGDSYFMRAGAKLLVKVRNSGTEDKACTLTVTANTYQALDTDNAKELAFMTYGQTEQVSFTAEEEGVYKITASAEDKCQFNVKCKVNDYAENGNGATIYLNSYGYGNSVPLLNSLYLNKGDKVYLTIKPSPSNSNADAAYEHTISVSVKPDGKFMLATGTADTNIADVDANGVAWVKYTAGKDASYQFALKQGETDWTVYLYKINSSYGTMNTYSESSPIWMQKDSIVFLKVNNSSSSEALTYTLSVTAKEPLMNENVLIEKYNDTRTVSFTAEKSGIYKITAYTYDGYFSVYYGAGNPEVNDQENDGNWTASSSASGDGVSKRVYLKSGETEYINVRYNYYSATNTNKYMKTLSIHAELKDEVEAVSGAASSVEIPAMTKKYIAYTSDDEVVAVVQCNQQVYLYNNVANVDSRIPLSDNAIKYIPIAAGKTVLLLVDNTYSNATETLKVTTTSFEPDVLSTKDTTVEFTKAGDVKAYRLVAPEDRFSYQITGSLASFNASMECWRNLDSMDSKTFSSSNTLGVIYFYNIKAGDTIYVIVHPTNQSNPEDAFEKSMKINIQ